MKGNKWVYKELQPEEVVGASKELANRRKQKRKSNRDLGVVRIRGEISHAFCFKI